MLRMRSLAFLLGAITVLPWWLGIWASGYLGQLLYLVVHNMGFAGYGYYVMRFVQFLQGGLFAVLLTIVMTRWFKKGPIGAFFIFMIGYILGAILLAFLASNIGVRVRVDVYFFGFGWLVFISVGLLLVLLFGTRRNATAA